MSKKRKSKKNKRPNVVDSRIDLSVPKTERERNWLKEQVERNRCEGGFYIQYTPTDTVDKSSGRILVKDIDCWDYKLKVSKYNILMPKQETMTTLSHAWVESEIINNLSTVNKIGLANNEGLSIASLGDYMRINGTMSICFNKPSPLNIMVKAGVVAYQRIFTQLLQSRDKYDIKESLRMSVEHHMYQVAERLSIKRELAKLYINDSELIKHLSK